MAATEIKVQMQQRRDTAAGWTSANPILLSGEFGHETDTGKFKIGDGTTAWNSLGYIAGFSISSYPLATADIADDAITADKLADTSVTAGSYTAADITVDAQGRITAAASGTIGTSELADDSVTADKLDNTAVTAGSYTAANITVDAQGRVTSAANGSGITVGDTSISVTDTGTDGTITFDTDGSEAVRIDSSGNLGIGTTSPSDLLHISDDGGAGILIERTGAPAKIQTSFGGGDAAFKYTVNNANSYIVGIDDGDSDKFKISYGSSDNAAFGTNDYVVVNSSGDVGIKTTSPSATLDVNGSLSKNSGSFRINHPLSALTETHHLVHSFVEAPDASNLYAGMVDLVDGTTTVNIDTAHRMTEGTFEALNTVQSWSSSNETGYAPVKCSISGNLLTIECQDATSTDTVYYEVRGIRKDQHMLDTHWTDENGRVITEPLKPAEETTSEPLE